MQWWWIRQRKAVCLSGHTWKPACYPNDQNHNITLAREGNVLQKWSVTQPNSSMYCSFLLLFRFSLVFMSLIGVVGIINTITKNILYAVNCSDYITHLKPKFNFWRFRMWLSFTKMHISKFIDYSTKTIKKIQTYFIVTINTKTSIDGGGGTVLKCSFHVLRDVGWKPNTWFWSSQKGPELISIGQWNPK